MAHSQKTDFVFRRNGRVHLKRPGASVQSTTGSRGVRFSGSNAGYTTFRGSVKSTGYPLHSPVSPSLPLPCVTVCHHISTGLYLILSLKVEPSSHCLFCCNLHVIIYSVAVDLCGVFKHVHYEHRSVSSFRHMDDDDPQSPSETRQFLVVIFHTDKSRRNRI
jgi:hypothetical protein